VFRAFRYGEQFQKNLVSQGIPATQLSATKALDGARAVQIGTALNGQFWRLPFSVVESASAAFALRRTPPAVEFKEGHVLPKVLPRWRNLLRVASTAAAIPTQIT
jgi:hypothetical protein